MAHSEQNARAIRLLTERAAARTRKEAAEAGDGVPTLTPARIVLSCREHDGFESPELNDRLYLHFGGFRRIENLEPYTKVKALWLDSNALSTIEGLSHMRELRCLYLQQNAILRVGAGLAGLLKLQTLDLSSNRLDALDGLDQLPLLQTLVLAKNALASAATLRHLQGCLALTNLDLSDNALVGDAALPPRDSPLFEVAAAAAQRVQDAAAAAAREAAAIANAERAANAAAAAAAEERSRAIEEAMDENAEAKRKARETERAKGSVEGSG